MMATNLSIRGFMAMFFVITGFAAPALAGTPPLTGSMSQFRLLSTPLPAPEARFIDEKEMARSIGDYKGKVVVLNLWATWCAPCVAEMPSLARLAAHFPGDDLAVLTVSQDLNGTKTLIEDFYRKHNITGLPILLDPQNGLAQNLAIRGLPATFLFDRQGQLVGYYAGAAEWDSDDAKALVKYYLDQH